MKYWGGAGGGRGGGHKKPQSFDAQSLRPKPPDTNPETLKPRNPRGPEGPKSPLSPNQTVLQPAPTRMESLRSLSPKTRNPKALKTETLKTQNPKTPKTLKPYTLNHSKPQNPEKALNIAGPFPEEKSPGNLSSASAEPGGGCSLRKCRFGGVLGSLGAFRGFGFRV